MMWVFDWWLFWCFNFVGCCFGFCDLFELRFGVLIYSLTFGWDCFVELGWVLRFWIYWFWFSWFWFYCFCFCWFVLVGGFTGVSFAVFCVFLGLAFADWFGFGCTWICFGFEFGLRLGLVFCEFGFLVFLLDCFDFVIWALTCFWMFGVIRYFGVFWLLKFLLWFFWLGVLIICLYFWGLLWWIVLFVSLLYFDFGLFR